MTDSRRMPAETLEILIGGVSAAGTRHAAAAAAADKGKTSAGLPAEQVRLLLENGEMVDVSVSSVVGFRQTAQEFAKKLI